MLIKKTVGYASVIFTLAVSGCSDVEDDVFEAYKCAKSADIFSDRKMRSNALFKMEEIAKEKKITNSSELIMNVGQRARNEYEPYGSSTSGQYQIDVFRDWYQSSYCQRLKESDLYGKAVHQKIAVARKVTIENELSLTVKDRLSFLKLNQFLDANKGKVIKLSLNSCPELQLECGQIQMTDSSISYNADYERCDYDSEIGEGITIYLGSNTKNVSTNDSIKTNHCDMGNGISLSKNSGIYKVPSSAGWGQGWTEWLLENVQ